MNRRNIFSLSATAALGFALLASSAVAQPTTLKDQLVGTWIMTSNISTDKDGKTVDVWGPDPLGMCMYDSSGHFSQIILRSDLPKTASRDKGTPEQDRAVVAGSLAEYGTYYVNEAEKTVVSHRDGTTFAAFRGADGTRVIVSLTGDELKFSTPATSNGLVAVSTWKRAK